MLQWLRLPLFAPDGPAAGGGAASGEDDGFVIESGSVAFTHPPVDTTEGRTEEAAPAPDAHREDSQSAVAPREDGDEVHASAATATLPSETEGEAAVVPATPPRASKPASKPASGEKRVKALQREIDTLTYTKHRTAEEAEQLASKKRQLETEIAELERRRPAPAAATSPAAATAETDAAVEPPHPNYRNFATDEEYEAAVATWRTSHAAWTDRRMAQLKQEITDGVEARFSSADQALAARAAQSTMATTLRDVSGRFPDWHEKADALAEVRSAWYDPAKHGKATTPFLSDLTTTLLQRGRAEGGEILHWLGSDPERAQRLADLRPTRPVRDAIVHAPSARALLEFFATDEGAREFTALTQMHPIQMMQTVGALSVRFAPAPRGSGAAAHPITQARPSAQPPGGSPGARTETAVTGAADEKKSYLDWHLDEDATDIITKARQHGVTVTRDEARAMAQKRLAG